MAKEVFFTINSDTGKAVTSIKELETEVKRLKTEWKETDDVIARQKAAETFKKSKTELDEFNKSIKTGKSFTDTLASATSKAIKEQLGLNLAMKENPIGFIVGLVALLVGAFTKLYDSSEKVRAGVKGLYEGIKVVFVGIKDLAVQYLGGVGTLIVGVFTGNIDKIKEGFGKLVDLPAAAVRIGKDALAAGQKAANEYSQTIEALEKRLEGINKDIGGASGPELESLKKQRDELDAIIKKKKESSDFAKGSKLDLENEIKLLTEKRDKLGDVDAAERKILQTQIDAKQKQLDSVQGKVDPSVAKNAAQAVKDKEKEFADLAAIEKDRSDKNKEQADKDFAVSQTQIDEATAKKIEAKNKEYAEQVKIEGKTIENERDFQQELLGIQLEALKQKEKYYEDDPVKLAEILKQKQDILTASSKVELDNATKTADEKKKIEDKAKADADKKSADASKLKADQEKATNDFVLQASQQLANDLVNIVVEGERRKTEEKLKAINEQRDIELAAIDEQQAKEEGTFVAKTATQIKYDEKRKQLRDKFAAEERAIKIKQFNSEKEASVIQSLINTAVAVTKVIENPFLAVAVGIFGAIQTALIAAQPVPKFSGGGIFKGPSHSAGGIPLTNGGNKVGEVEGGEIILNRNVSRYPELVNLVSNINSATGGRSFGFNRFTPTTKFAEGGIVNPFGGNDFSDLSNAVDRLNKITSQPLRSYVVEQEISSAQNLNNVIERRSRLYE